MASSEAFRKSVNSFIHLKTAVNEIIVRYRAKLNCTMTEACRGTLVGTILVASALCRGDSSFYGLNPRSNQNPNFKRNPTTWGIHSSRKCQGNYTLHGSNP